jgi:hypothetical protein
MHLYTEGVNCMRKNPWALIVALAISVALLAAGCSAVKGKQSPTDTAKPTAPVVSHSATISSAPTSPAIAPPSTTDKDLICGDTSHWTTKQQQSRPLEQQAPISEEVYKVTAAVHLLCDRVSFYVNLPTSADKVVDWTVRYVPRFTSEPSGEPVTLTGAAVLQVTIQAPDFGSASTGHQPGRQSWKAGQTILLGNDWPSVLEVKFAGSSEHVSVFGIGVASAQRPFRVWTMPYGSATLVVVDVRH